MSNIVLPEKALYFDSFNFTLSHEFYHIPYKSFWNFGNIIRFGSNGLGFSIIVGDKNVPIDNFGEDCYNTIYIPLCITQKIHNAYQHYRDVSKFVKLEILLTSKDEWVKQHYPHISKTKMIILVLEGGNITDAFMTDGFIRSRISYPSTA